MNSHTEINVFQNLLKSDQEDGELFSAIRNLMTVSDTDDWSESMKSTPQLFGSWSGWSY